jgi:sec-independent protein translocase protein TatA
MLEGLFQPMHLIVILFIALMVFGPKKLPELGKGLGDGIRSFKDSMRERQENLAKTDNVTVSEAGENEALPGHSN